MTQKTCFKCGKSKPLTDFYAHPQMKDGRLNKCKECAKEYAHGRADYERARFQTAHRKAKASEYQKKTRIDQPDKYKARQILGNALRDGRLARQPCEVCQTTVDVQAHHDDYNKPLEVRWLCFQHHREVHGQTIIKTGTG
jgi:hypothetical protein